MCQNWKLEQMIQDLCKESLNVGLKIDRQKSIVTQTVVICWYCGNERESVLPLWFISSHDIEKGNGRVLVCQWRKMMEHVKWAAVKVGYTIPRDENMRVVDTMNLYAAVKPLFRYKSNHKRRHEGILWKTIFNNITKNKGMFADELSNWFIRPKQSPQNGFFVLK